MLQTFKNAWKIPELKKRMMFTLLMLFLYRLGSQIPVPFIDKQAVATLMSQGSNSILGFLDLMAGGNITNFSIFLANIYPYITASIVLQLLTVAIPSLEALSKEGETGRKKIAAYTRYLGIAMAAVQAIGFTMGIFRKASLAQGFLQHAVVILSIVAGASLLIWIGEKITENGIGNGISIIIFAGIVTRFPMDIVQSFNLVKQGYASPIFFILFIIIAIVIIVFVVALNEGERRISVQYAKRVVGRKMYGGQSTHIPIKVLMSGVMPIIFANSILAIPATIAMFMQDGSKGKDFIIKWFTTQGTPGTVLYIILSVIFIIFFTYFYTTIQFNTVEYSKNLQQNGGFIPGIRPGKPTSDYMQRVLNRLVLPGAIALAILTVLPVILGKVAGLPFSFGGTSMIIVVGVVLETARVLEQQMLMRHYKGFLK